MEGLLGKTTKAFTIMSIYKMILFIDGQGIFFNKELSFQIKENSFSSTQSKPNNEINLIKFVTISNKKEIHYS